jgi:hypothetical protein
MEKLNELLNPKKVLTDDEKIQLLKNKHPGKYDDLQKPTLGSAFRNWSDEDIQEVLDLLKKKIPNS